jgi:hypothetical protein
LVRLSGEEGVKDDHGERRRRRWWESNARSLGDGVEAGSGRRRVSRIVESGLVKVGVSWAKTRDRSGQGRTHHK